MSPLATFVFYLLGVVFFVAAGIGVTNTRRPSLNLVGIGLACVWFVAVWNAAVAL